MTFQDFKQFVTALFSAEDDNLHNYMTEVEADNFLLGSWVDGVHPVDAWSEFIERPDIQSQRAR